MGFLARAEQVGQLDIYGICDLPFTLLEVFGYLLTVQEDVGEPRGAHAEPCVIDGFVIIDLDDRSVKNRASPELVRLPEERARREVRFLLPPIRPDPRSPQGKPNWK